MDDAPADTDLAVAALAAWFGTQLDVTRVTADVARLARSPRGRRHHPEEMATAEEYVSARLTEAGWTVTAAPFERRWVIGVSDAGGQVSIVRRLRLYPRLRGVNLLADLPGAPAGRRVLVVAHLDSVACSPGADDNASGVAALIECARLLGSLPDPPAVTLAVVDLEELGKVGSGALANDRAYVSNLKAVICLESVGTFHPESGTQRLGGLGLLFRNVAGRVRAKDDLLARGDLTRPARDWSWFLGRSIGHGYRPARAAWALLILYLVTLASVWLGARADGFIQVGDIAPQPSVTASHCGDAYPCLSAPAYALENITPILNLHQAENWQPKSSTPAEWVLRDWLYLTTVVGYAGTTLLAAGLSGLARSA